MGIVMRIDAVGVVDGVRTVTVDGGNGSPDDLELYLPPGEDSLPMVNDLVIVVDADGNDGPVAVAVLDENTPDGDEGGKRLYARKADGTPVCWVHLKTDGVIEISNGSGTFEMAKNGTVTINGNLEVLP